MTNPAVDLRSFEAIKQRVEAKYKELQAARQEVATQGTRFREVCQRIPDADLSAVEGYFARIEELGKKISQFFEELWNDVTFPLDAYEDGRKWTEIGSVAFRLSSVMTNLYDHGTDPQGWRVAGGMSKTLGRANAYPNR